MQNLISKSFLKLKAYCEKEEYKGWDPYDGLNSKIFQATPLKKSKFARLAWIQLFKRNPINLRKLLKVPKGYNPKGIGLFLTGYCNLYEIAESGNIKFGDKEELKEKINHLADLLIELQSDGYSGACWGYNFDWQSRAFFLPDGTPTVVATTFATDALICAYECTGEDKYLKTAKSAAEFVLNDLNRIDKGDNLYMFSYSPLDERAVYNATLLGTRLLSQVYQYSGDEHYKTAAKISAEAVCLTQKNNGAFPHSDQVGDQWRDNFHTGFKLEALAVYQKYCNDSTFEGAISKGFEYWKENFFLPDGTAKYYDNEKFPIDLHCTAQAVVTFFKTNNFESNYLLIKKVLVNAVRKMQDVEDGFFYFQETKYFKNKIPYMRWPNAWMFYGMSYWLLYTSIHDKH